MTMPIPNHETIAFEALHAVKSVCGGGAAVAFFPKSWNAMQHRLAKDVANVMVGEMERGEFRPPWVLIDIAVEVASRLLGTEDGARETAIEAASELEAKAHAMVAALTAGSPAVDEMLAVRCALRDAMEAFLRMDAAIREDEE